MSASLKGMNDHFSFYGMLKDVFRLSYISLERFLVRQTDFDTWCRLKPLYDARLNRIIFRFLAANRSPRRGMSAGLSQKRTYDAIYYVIKHHLQQREKIRKIAARFPLPLVFTFHVLSFTECGCSVLKGLAIAVLSHLRGTRFSKHWSGEQVVVCINFPRHAFALDGGAGGKSTNFMYEGFPTSLGAFLELEWGSRSDSPSFLSINEYVRHSRKREGVDVVDSDTPRELRRLVAPTETGARELVYTLWVGLTVCWRAFFALFRPNQILEWEFLRADIRGDRISRTVRRVKKQGAEIRAIYVLPFDDIGAARYDPLFVEQLINFSYSQNLSVPPIVGHRAKGDGDVDYCGGEYSFYSYFLTGKAVGFNAMYEDVAKSIAAANKLFGSELPARLEPQPKQVPVLLGFEKAGAQPLPDGRPELALFDVPPEQYSETFRRAVVGDQCCSLEYVRAFLEDAIEVAANCGLRVVLKPKYSLTNYVAAYQDAIVQLSRSYSEFFRVENPYTNIGNVLAGAKGSVSFPFTSTHFLATSSGLPSVYYFPERFANSYFGRNDAYRCVLTKVELGRFLKNL